MAAVAAPIFGGHHASFLPNSTQSSSAAVGTSSQSQSAQMQDQEIFEDFPVLYCRALYDYDAQDASALSFRRNDIIEVLTQQASGWWDGLLREERGWFPSNYVTIISEEDAELALSGSDFSNTDTSGNSNQRHSVVDISHAMMRGSQSDNEEWLDSELNGAGSGVDDLANSMWETAGSSSDFWMPQVDPNGQIFYVNTKTGQQSRDLPQETEDEISDTDLAALTSQASSRSGTSARLAFASNNTFEPAASDSDTAGNMAGFGLPRRTGTPEPWVKKLADDGMSYFYYNKVDGSVQWTRPEIPRTHSSKTPTQPSHTTSSVPRPQSFQPGDTNRFSVFSDSSDIQPLDNARNFRSDTNGHSGPVQQPAYVDSLVMELTGAERIAQLLQKALAPPPPEILTDLSATAKNAIQAVVDNIQLNGIMRRTEDDRKMDDMIHAVVLAVRNLLYVSAIPTGQIPNHVLPRSAHEREIKAAQSTPSPLKPAQRKVTATLSRLVLSARAMQYDSGSSLSDTLNRIEVDADELERAVISFVLEVQRNRSSAASETKPDKRLYGVFSTANIGLGLVGAGAAGTWKGFGWVSLDADEQNPQKVLSTEVANEVGSHVAQLNYQFVQLGTTLKSLDFGAVRSETKDFIVHVSSFLSFVTNIHIARHVDIDGIRQESNHAPNDLYVQSVINARLLVRTLECAVQALYDDAAALFLASQSWREEDPQAVFDDADLISASIQANLAVVQQSLDDLLSIGHDQAEIGQGDYNGSIEWRMSRLSVIDTQLGGSGGSACPASPLPGEYETPGDDVVDMGYAFSRAPAADRASYPRTQHTPNASVAISTNGNSLTEATEETVVGYEVEEVLSTFPHDEPSPFYDEMQPLKTQRKKDLKGLLGDEYREAPEPPPPEPPETPWYLLPKYDPAEILIDPDNSVRGGTVPALVERLTAHEQADRAFIKAFMMTFKSFTTVDELFDLLVQRFRIQPPPDLSPKELENWTTHKQRVIQMRVLNTFKSMVLDDDILDKDDMHILQHMKEFISSDEVSHFAAAKQLMLHIERAQKGGDRVRIVPVNLTQAPPPIYPKQNKKLKLADIEPLELARQLTIMESDLFQRIKPMECLQRAREQKTENADNITTVIHASNRIADWVADSILTKDDSRRRASTVKHLISVADRCRTLNNFSTMIAITSGLNTPPIRRLKRTWEQVSQRYLAQFGACEMTIDSNKNFNKYRSLMATVTPPCVPFIGVFLSTLQFIQDGNPDNLPGGLVNFKKRQKASEVISDIQRWQAQSFNFQPIPAIQQYIEDSLSQFNDTTKATSDMFWALSLEREPREREDEKMARLLQESGFL
ncbi:ras guanine nucleotide exchange factor domain-containing protein [Desarmillaria tabescens]|uniref:Ras guanine nucleotide exchange factor domain-containing protein n=1 Tax=Armillaria tabescens TaxID=1929756 RepID=A0AA39NF37_ARMTA|nr:ras guanine nucleotide exchange factor domain-containing protein [Desarmillaria tabescens]KAK0464469.1 ras guanine nucleotide exchange factor domain-containing protein [Desarmillaria tabescens]